MAAQEVNVLDGACASDPIGFSRCAKTIWTESRHKHTQLDIAELVEVLWIDEIWPFANKLLVAA